MVDAVLAAFVVGMVALVFFLYLLVRRTVTQFTEGVERGKGEG